MIKCIIWDLDGTIWDGSIDEMNDLTLMDNLDEILNKLMSGGIINSIVSRNHRKEAIEALSKFNIEKYFVIPQFDFNSKCISIKKITEELNINLDSVLFIDNSEFELAQVNYYLPQVKTLLARDYEKVLDIVGNDGTLNTYESINRTLLYKLISERKVAEKEYLGNREDFLRECKIILNIRNANRVFLPYPPKRYISLLAGMS